MSKKKQTEEGFQEALQEAVREADKAKAEAVPEVPAEPPKPANLAQLPGLRRVEPGIYPIKGSEEKVDLDEKDIVQKQEDGTWTQITTPEMTGILIEDKKIKSL